MRQLITGLVVDYNITIYVGTDTLLNYLGSG
jgi:hypothetical protein